MSSSSSMFSTSSTQRTKDENMQQSEINLNVNIKVLILKEMSIPSVPPWQMILSQNGIKDQDHHLSKHCYLAIAAQSESL